MEDMATMKSWYMDELFNYPCEKVSFPYTHHCDAEDKLATAVKNEVEKYGKSLIIDAQSFPKNLFSYEKDLPRPDICVGTCENTPNTLKNYVVEYFTGKGYKVAENRPFGGSVVPLKYEGDKHVMSIMIKVNRGLYIEDNHKLPRFLKVKFDMYCLLDELKNEVFG